VKKKGWYALTQLSPAVFCFHSSILRRSAAVKEKIHESYEAAILVEAVLLRPGSTPQV